MRDRLPSSRKGNRLSCHLSTSAPFFFQEINPGTGKSNNFAAGASAPRRPSDSIQAVSDAGEMRSACSLLLPSFGLSPSHGQQNTGWTVLGKEDQQRGSKAVVGLRVALTKSKPHLQPSDHTDEDGTEYNWTGICIQEEKWGGGKIMFHALNCILLSSVFDELHLGPLVSISNLISSPACLCFCLSETFPRLQ